MAIFSDAQLIQIVIKAARRINRRLCLTETSDEISIDSTTGEILSPDDSNLEDLVLLQAECLLLNTSINNDFNSVATGTAGGFKVRDGEQTFDNRGEISSIVGARNNYLNTDYNPCAELEREIVKEKLKRSCDMRDIW